MTLFTILLPTLLIHTLTTTMTLPQKIIHRQRVLVLFHLLDVVAIAILPIQLMIVVMMTTEEESCQPTHLKSPLMLYVPLQSCGLFKMTMAIQSFSPIHLVIFGQRVVLSLPSNPLPPYIDYSMTVSMPSQNLGRERYFSRYAFGSLA